jgi:hypothetical protein
VVAVTALGVLLGLVAAAWAVALCLGRVRRLHRLHIRVDAARAGLDAALARRAAAASAAGVAVSGVAVSGVAVSGVAVSGVAVSGVAVSGGAVPDVAAPDVAGPPGGAVPGGDSGATRDPEAVANALSRALARLDRAALADDVRAALADAEQLLVLARRVHNDAVRDTLGLRSRRLVRWLRLAGTAPMPTYFEIADPPAALTYDRVSPSQE